MHSNEVPAFYLFYLTHYTTMFVTVMSGSVCYLRIISKGIPTPCVKRQQQRQTVSIGMHCDTPLMLENQSPPLFSSVTMYFNGIQFGTAAAA